MTGWYTLFGLFYLVILLAQSVQAEVQTRYYELEITENTINPDCSNYTSPVFLVNKQMPGPPIKGNQGDTLNILVRNGLPPNSEHRNDVSIHFHGIRQYGSNGADGVPLLTQYAISPGEEFVQEFQLLNQAGTFFYHAHVGLQQETVFGPLIIYESEEANPEILQQEDVSSLLAGESVYDAEHVFVLSEWWHRPRLEFEDFLMGSTFTFLPEAHSVLINGRTIQDTANIAPTCGGYDVTHVQPNKTYRVRVIGATTFRTLGFAIANHNLTIIEVDGELVKPYTVNELEVAPGQRFSVLIQTNHDVDDYAVGVVRRWSDTLARPTNGQAILRYIEPAAAPNNSTSESESRGVLRLKRPIIMAPPKNQPAYDSIETEVPHWLWDNLEPLNGPDPVTFEPASRTMKLRSIDRRLPDGTTRWQVNGIAYTEEMGATKEPILYSVLNKTRALPGKYDTTNTNGYDPSLRTYPVYNLEVLDIVIQTTHMPGEPCRSHPWHTHGHSHWEIAYGQGEYDHERDGDIRNIQNPLLKDITMIYPMIDPEYPLTGTSPVGCGWSKIRIVAVSSTFK